MIENAIERCCVVEYTRVAASRYRCSQRFADCEGQNAAEKRKPRYGCPDHHAARKRADGDAKKKSATQSDRVGERSREQRKHRHRRRPHPADQGSRGLIAEAEVLRKPQNHRFVRDRVGGVDEELDQERQPQLALSAFEDGELRDESSQPALRSGRSNFFDGWVLFRDFCHRFETT